MLIFATRVNAPLARRGACGYTAGPMSSSLLKTSTLVGALTAISRIMGFVRDAVIARAFGASAGADAFFIAFRIPNLLRRLFAEGAFAQAFVPVLAGCRERQSHAEVRALVDQASARLGLLSLLLTAAGMALAPVLVLLFAPGYAGSDQFELTVDLLRITFPYLLFISLTALFSAIMNAYGRFAVPAITPLLLNLAMIAAAVWWAPRVAEPVEALAWGVFLGGLAQLLWQLPFVARLGLLPRPRWGTNTDAARMLRRVLPTVFGASAAQINLLVNALLASFLVTGSVSWLYYADRLVEFPLGLVGLALTAAVLPSLSRAYASRSAEDYGRTLAWALRWAALMGVPATFALVLLSGPVLVTLFQYGEFTVNDVAQTRLSLMAYSLAIVPFIAIKVLTSAYYARDETAAPVRAAAVAIAANVLIGLPLMRFMGHAGVALATSLAAWLNAWLLYRDLKRRNILLPAVGGRRFAVAIVLGSAVMSLVLLGAGDWRAWTEMAAAQRVARLLLWVAAGAVGYAVALWLSRLRWGELRGPGA